MNEILDQPVPTGGHTLTNTGEAAASLDVENETLIQAALSRLIKDKTVLAYS